MRVEGRVSEGGEGRRGEMRRVEKREKGVEGERVGRRGEW